MHNLASTPLASTAETWPMRKSTMGRAELLLGLCLAEQDAQREQGLALAAGYEKEAHALAQQEEQTPNPEQFPDKTEEKPKHPAPALNVQKDEAASLGARFWAITERTQLAPHTNPANPHAKLPLHLHELMQTQTLAQSKTSIVPRARLMPALKRSLPSERLGGVDFASLINSLSQAKTLRRLPRRQLKGWTERLLLVLDISEPLAPYRQDMHALVADLQAWIGSEKLEVRILEDERFPAGTWLNWSDQTNTSFAADWQTLGADRPILYVSELGLYANDRGHTKQRWAQCLRMLHEQGVKMQVWSPLPLGEAGEQILPRLPVVHWSAASRMRAQPLAGSELHRTAPRLQLAEQLCALLSTTNWLEPQLLRKLRLSLGPSLLDAGLEELVWNHPAMSRHAYARCLRSTALPRYRARFADLSSAQKQQALNQVRAVHLQHNPLLAQVETLTWAAYANDAERAVQQVAVKEAQSVLARLAEQPWQVAEIERSQIIGFMQRFLQTADLRTKAFCSPSMSRMYLALQEAGAEVAPESLRGLAAADLENASGKVEQRLPYYLGIDWEHGWLCLSAEAPAKPFLLAGPIFIGGLSIEMAGKVRWEMPQEPRDIAIARLPWGEQETIVDDWWKYAPFTPPLIDGPIWLETAHERIKIEEIMRPAWALEWGRNHEGLYVLVPNPWDKAIALSYPLRSKSCILLDQTISAQPKKKPSKKGKLKQAAAFVCGLRLLCDEIGPLAELSLSAANGTHSQAFRYIPPGQFLMGSPDTEEGRAGDEGPQHQVTISQGFWLADTACTQGFWQAIMGHNPSEFNEKNHGSAEHPVEKVSWNDVQEFIQKLAAFLPNCQPGLPTEAEWEYACRAGSTTPFSFGATICTEEVNYRGDAYGAGQEGKLRGHTVAVKDLPANKWGLYQMHGNVWEWCADRMRQYTENGVIDPGLDAANGDMYVLRGGGWFNGAQHARSAYRIQCQRGRQDGYTGFRLLLRSSRLSSRF